MFKGPLSQVAFTHHKCCKRTRSEVCRSRRSASASTSGVAGSGATFALVSSSTSEPVNAVGFVGVSIILFRARRSSPILECIQSAYTTCQQSKGTGGERTGARMHTNTYKNNMPTISADPRPRHFERKHVWCWWSHFKCIGQVTVSPLEQLKGYATGLVLALTGASLQLWDSSKSDVLLIVRLVCQVLMNRS